MIFCHRNYPPYLTIEEYFNQLVFSATLFLGSYLLGGYLYRALLTRIAHFVQLNQVERILITLFVVFIIAIFVFDVLRIAYYSLYRQRVIFPLQMAGDLLLYCGAVLLFLCAGNIHRALDIMTGFFTGRYSWGYWPSEFAIAGRVIEHLFYYWRSAF